MPDSLRAWGCEEDFMLQSVAGFCRNSLLY